MVYHYEGNQLTKSPVMTAYTFVKAFLTMNPMGAYCTVCNATVRKSYPNDERHGFSPPHSPDPSAQRSILLVQKRKDPVGSFMFLMLHQHQTWGLGA